MPREVDLGQRRERLATPIWPVLASGLAAAALVVGALVGVHFYLRWGGVSVAATPPNVFPAPQLQPDPTADMLAVRAAQREQLSAYGAAEGRFRIPVARAMELLAARGAAAFAPLQAAEPGRPLPVRAEAARMREGGR